VKEEINKIEKEEIQIEGKLKDNIINLSQTIEGEKSLISGLYKR